MRRGPHKTLAVAAALLLGLGAGGAQAAADFNGYWVLKSDPMAVPKAPATPAAARKAKELLAARGVNAPEGSPEYARLWCTTPGLPWVQTGKAPIDIRQNALDVTITYAAKANPRHIYLDGQKHPDEETFDFTPVGHSVGRWQGDTLVADTRYFKDGVVVIPGGGLRTEKSRLTERFSLVDHDTLRVTYTWTDPTTLKGAHTYSYVYKRAPGVVWMTDPQCNPVPAMRKKGLHVPFDAKD